MRAGNVVSGRALVLISALERKKKKSNDIMT